MIYINIEEILLLQLTHILKHWNGLSLFHCTI